LEIKDMEITAAVLRAKDQPLSIEQLQLKELGDDEIIVRIAGTGICHTDISCQEYKVPVPLPIVLGHEGAGIVEKVGKSVTKVAPNDHVVLLMPSCGICPMCLEGKVWWCYYGLYVYFGIGSAPVPRFQPYVDGVTGGFLGQSSFASHVLTKEKGVTKVNPKAPIDILGPFACSVLTGAGTVFHALNVEAGSTIAIFGVGAIGLNALIATNLSACSTIIAIDIVDERLKLAEELGATHVINAKKVTNISKAIKDILPNGVDYVVDTTAINDNIVHAIDAISKGGTIGLLGVARVEAALNVNMYALLVKGVRIKAIAAGEVIADNFIPKMVDLFMQGKYPITKMITHYPFEQIQQAMNDQRQCKIIKAVLNF
jgi:aryl-alcohol dehydrogenase